MLTVDKFQNRFNSGDPVAVKGKVTEFNDFLQLTVTQINIATEKQYSKYGFSSKLLVKTVDEPIDDLWKRLTKLVNTLKQPYKELMVTIFKKYKSKILQYMRY